MNWLIVGHGALASLWAHHLLAAGEAVTLITRDTVGQAAPDVSHRSAADIACPTPDVPGSSGGRQSLPYATSPHHQTFTLETNSGIETRDIPCVPWSQLSETDLDQAHILIMVKAWQLDEAVRQLATQLQRTKSQPAAIILSHNGLGAAEKTLQQHAGWPVYDLVTTHGAWRKSPLHVVHAGQGHSYIGSREATRESACSTPPVWFPSLANALPPLSWEPHILTRRWHKLAINCAINPLASLAGKPNGVLKDERYRDDIEGVCEEIARVADLVLGQGVVQAEQLVTQVYQVINATTENTCSMLQDIQHGNPTEIDYLNGYIARLGAEFDIPTPINHRLQQEIEAIHQAML
ncbi:MAG: ketopantoate reductase family protein [Idiomarina sp.]|nr:ketopantoate reductase family protein [Idiomarina sp.]